MLAGVADDETPFLLGVAGAAVGGAGALPTPSPDALSFFLFAVEADVAGVGCIVALAVFLEEASAAADPVTPGAVEAEANPLSALTSRSPTPPTGMRSPVCPVTLWSPVNPIPFPVATGVAGLTLDAVVAPAAGAAAAAGASDFLVASSSFLSDRETRFFSLSVKLDPSFFPSVLDGVTLAPLAAGAVALSFWLSATACEADFSGSVIFTWTGDAPFSGYSCGPSLMGGRVGALVPAAVWAADDDGVVEVPPIAGAVAPAAPESVAPATGVAPTRVPVGADAVVVVDSADEARPTVGAVGTASLALTGRNGM